MPTSVQALIVIAVAITPGYICLDGDDSFVEPDPGSAGVWIAAEGIVRVEFTEEGMIGGSQ